MLKELIVVVVDLLKGLFKKRVVQEVVKHTASEVLDKQKDKISDMINDQRDKMRESSKKETVEKPKEKPAELPTVKLKDRSQIIKEKIWTVLSVFETGKLSGDYSMISIFADGPNSIKQITYGKHQTTEFSHLNSLIEKYVELGGKYAEFFKPYIGRIGKTPSLHKDQNLLGTLRKAGSDPIMVKAQDYIFETKYWARAYEFFQKEGFKEALSLLVIYDSYVHSGSIPSFLRKRFPAVTPANGGNERDWIKQYVETRQDWLKTRSRTILRNTIYRTQTFLNEMKAGNWDLSMPIKTQGLVIK